MQAPKTKKQSEFKSLCSAFWSRSSHADSPCLSFHSFQGEGSRSKVTGIRGHPISYLCFFFPSGSSVSDGVRSKQRNKGPLDLGGKKSFSPEKEAASGSPMTQLLSGATRQSEAWMSSLQGRLASWIMAASGTRSDQKDFKSWSISTVRLEGLHFVGRKGAKCFMKMTSLFSDDFILCGEATPGAAFNLKAAMQHQDRDALEVEVG